MKKTQSFRLSKEIEDRLDGLCMSIEARCAGMEVSKSAVMRAALVRGMEAMEDEIFEVNPTKTKVVEPKKKVKR